ncbi:MAG TPA: hypothetical protein VFE91_00385, partial [Nitrososphaerales archaeon]|nr:hypothetical protein [Nitrososphaerales archaeon]
MTVWSGAKGSVEEWVDENAPKLAQLSDSIFNFAEPSLREYKSSKLLAGFLDERGFETQLGVAGLPTAFVSSWGTKGPVFGFMAEYDAIPDRSQKAVPWEEPTVPSGPGFTDAHNMLGSASCFGAVAVKEAAEKHGLDLQVRVFGTPAEKLCVGKPYMARDGLFEGLDAMLAWHPGG